RDFGQTKSYSEETAGLIDEEVKSIFDKASEMCRSILTEHSKELKDIAEYLLEHETLDCEEFNYYFEHGEFMPYSKKEAAKASMDQSIERPARKIRMFDGTEDAGAGDNSEVSGNDSETQSSSESDTPAPEAPDAETPGTEDPESVAEEKSDI
ncbi:MAG: hypothetical protein Q4F31_09605, partial [Eubacteriales bacterium]|nr:hypothetical protein [Eubacteriales bacterium]